MAEYVIKRKLFSTRKSLSVTLKRKTFGALDGISQGVGNVMTTAANTAGNVIQAGVSTAKNVTGGVLEGTGTAVKSVGNTVGNVLDKGGTGLGAVAGGALGLVGGPLGAAIGAGVMYAGKLPKEPKDENK